MTRDEFFEEVTDWGELLSFCYNNGYDDYVEDVYSEESRDEEIHNDLNERFYDDSWQSIMDYLDGIPCDYDYYRKDDYGDWYGLDIYDFRERRDELVEALDNNDFWDEPEDEWNEDVDPEDLIPVPEESVSIFDIISSNKDVIVTESKADSEPPSIKELLYA